MESQISSEEVLKRYGTVAEGFENRLSRVTPEQLHLPTPCAEWDVEALILHVINTNFQVASRADESVLGLQNQEDDLSEQWQTVKNSVIDLLSNDETAEKMTTGAFGEQSFASLVGKLLCSDTLFHTWDLARATSQDTTLDQDAIDKAFAFLEPLDEAMRRPGGFAPKIAPSPNADLQTRFLNFGGRQT